MPSAATLPPVLVLAVGLALPGCFAAEEQTGVEPAPARPAYSAFGRARERQLEGDLRDILFSTLPAMRAARVGREEDVASVRPPMQFATVDPVLRHWHDEPAQAYSDWVLERTDATVERLQGLYDEALESGRTRAASMAAPRSPLDTGETGDPLLDRQLLAFEETLHITASIDEVDSQGQADAQLRTDLFEAFTSFATEGADERLGGRLMVFAGGPENLDPLAEVVLRVPEGESPEGLRLEQVVRHRIMRGQTIVQDLGWNLMPGEPQIETGERHLVRSLMAPVLDRSDPAFDLLRDMRILVDVQSVVLDDTDTIRGGANWRLEHRVTTRGDVSWQLAGGRPQFDAVCTEAAGVLGVEPGEPLEDDDEGDVEDGDVAAAGD